MIDYSKFKKSLTHLERQFTNYESLDDALPELMREAVAESVIQRFETCWDCLWKVVKRYLTEEVALPNVPNGPKPVLRLANENNLLPTPVEAWLAYAEARVSTSHDYSGEKADAALSRMRAFIDDARTLYETLSGKEFA